MRRSFFYQEEDGLHGSNRDFYGVGDGGVGEAVGDGADVTVFIIVVVFVIVAVEAGGLVEAYAGEFVDFGAHRKTPDPTIFY